MTKQNGHFRNAASAARQTPRSGFPDARSPARNGRLGGPVAHVIVTGNTAESTMKRTAAIDLQTMPGHLIRRAHQISVALFAEECGVYDLTSVQFAALHTISANPDVDATRLSELISFDRSTIGSVLERLEAKGWIVRTGSPGDRRVKLLRITPDGRDILKRVAPAVARVQTRLLEPLSPDDRETMMRLMNEIARIHDGGPGAASASD